MHATIEIKSHRNHDERRRSKTGGKSLSDETSGDLITNGTDQSMMGDTRITRRMSKRRPNFARVVKKSFRAFSKRSLFGESRLVSNRTTHHEQSIDFDVNSDDGEEKAPVIRTKKHMQATEQITDGHEECCTVATKESSLAEGIPKIIYIVNGSFLSKIGKGNPIKRIHKSFRRAISKREMIDDSDEEAYEKTLVEL